ncbi:MAG: hypothetical protein WCS96_02705 [Victivallales bacterium]|jgi:predicted nucleic acid-binding protein
MKPRIYLDTSVIGGCFDSEFELASRTLFEEIAQCRFIAVISEIVEEEIALAPEKIRELIGNKQKIKFEVLSENEETVGLAEDYLKAGIVGKSYFDDCRHVAIASFYNVDLLVSWNFKHIVQFDKIRRFNAINMLHGYRQIEIRSPMEVIHYEKE